MMYAINAVSFMSIIILLGFGRKRLETKTMKSWIEEMYLNINLRNSWYSLMFLPVWMYRRILYVATPFFILKGIPWAQIIMLFQTQIFYIIYYGYNACHKYRDIFRLHMVNEVFILATIYCSITWSNFVTNE